MARNCIFLLIACFLLGGGLFGSPVYAGDEDVKVEKPKAAPAEPDQAPVPVESEAPDLSMGEEPAAPDFKGPEETPAAAPEPKRVEAKPWDPDHNVDYSELISRVEPSEAERGILPPALGFRGYRPNMIVLSYNDRTPGFGALVEYSFNRIGMGAYYSYRPNTDENSLVESETFFGAYGSYRWLPYDISPLILLGLEVGSQTSESFGGIAGFGLDWRIFSGWTALLGYTYHSTVHRGFLGGGVGWSF